MRKTLSCLFGLLVVGTALVGGSGPAVAHAALVGTDPEDGAELATLPSEVSFEFNEPVRADAQVAVTAPDGSSVPVEEITAVDGTLTAAVAESGVRGEFVIAYRVISADGHPVSGQITVTTTDGEPPSGATEQETAESVDEGSFVHRHREHILWGVLVGVVAIGLIVAPLLRGRRR